MRDAGRGTPGCGRDDRVAPQRSADGGGDHHEAFERASWLDTAPSSTGPPGRSADTRRTPGRRRDRCKPQSAATPSSTSAARGFLDAGLQSCECSRVDHSSRSPTRLGASNTGPLLIRRHHSRARLSAQAGDGSRIQRLVTLTDTRGGDRRKAHLEPKRATGTIAREQRDANHRSHWCVASGCHFGCHALPAPGTLTASRALNSAHSQLKL